MFGSMHAPCRPPASRPALLNLAAAALLLSLGACTSLDIRRETQTSGTFRSRGWAVTILSIDLPQPALSTARENVSDARLVNVQVERAKVTPSLGWFDWLLDILGFRIATISGTWGFSGDE